MNWYTGFNIIEAALWWLVAAVILARVPCSTMQQRWGTVLGSVAFVAFGVTDLCEIRYEGAVPIWLWGAKVACGFGILASRYTWRGWNTFRWRDHEVLFGAGCLIAVVVMIALQRALVA